jgi:hypothetical protein
MSASPRRPGRRRRQPRCAGPRGAPRPRRRAPRPALRFHRSPRPPHRRHPRHGPGAAGRPPRPGHRRLRRALRRRAGRGRAPGPHPLPPARWPNSSPTSPGRTAAPSPPQPDATHPRRGRAQGPQLLPRHLVEAARRPAVPPGPRRRARERRPAQLALPGAARPAPDARPLAGLPQALHGYADALLWLEQADGGARPAPKNIVLGERDKKRKPARGKGPALSCTQAKAAPRPPCPARCHASKRPRGR